jgi:hypothetical protein
MAYDKEQYRKWYEKNKQKKIAQVKRYREKNKSKLNLIPKKYRA